MLAACNSSNEVTDSTADHPNGEIQLSAGLVEGGSAAVTRAGAEDNHTTPGHQNLETGTKLALQVSGTWTGHTGVGSDTEGKIIRYTTATIGTKTGTDDKHNNLSCSPVLYWDDYGTADPANAMTGRIEGLTIYGVAVNDETANAPEISETQWTSGLNWELSANQSEGIRAKDLLISNNVKDANSDSEDQQDHGRYLFDYHNQGKLLEFCHALSKITVNLKAGDGFAGNAFVGTPEVKLTSNLANATSATEWPLTTGTFNITTGNISSQSNNAAITMFNTATATTGWTKTYEALVMPGSEFTADNAIIARINADGNIYYVTAEAIRTAINSSTHATDGAYATEAGKNYVINVIVNKTAILVNATIAEWEKVIATTESPKINITASFANPYNIRYDQFSFYRSEYNSESPNINDGYTEGGLENDYYKPASRITYNSSTSNYSWDPQRYWSTHNQHFQFRLVWPRATTETKTNNPYHPHVETKTYDGKNCQVIEIENQQYEPLYIDAQKALDDNAHHPYPSNLMIARPEVGDENCTNHEPGHEPTKLYSEGICAREGYIDLKFNYVMSQVEVNLTTTSDEASVNLAGAVVVITNIYSKGYVKLGDREVKTDGTTGNYTMTIAKDDHATTDVDESQDANKRHSAIVPQTLTYTTAQASTNVQFRITLANGDVYYADVAPIKKKDSSDLVAPNGAWESGYHYIYELNISKTAIKVNATLADWTTVEASQEIWF